MRTVSIVPTVDCSATPLDRLALLGPIFKIKMFTLNRPSAIAGERRKVIFNKSVPTCATKVVKKLAEKNEPLLLAVLRQVDEGPLERMKKPHTSVIAVILAKE